MDKFEYLTINNITKVYSNNIFTDSDGTVLTIQWFPFQLEYIFEKLGLQIYNNGLRYTNKQMGDLIKSFFSGKDIEIKDTKESLIAMGLYGGGKITNTYSPVNLGGHLLFKPEINEYGSSIKKPIGKTHYSLELPKKRLIQIRKLVSPVAKKQIDCVFKNIDSRSPISGSILYLLENYIGLNTNRASIFKNLLEKNGIGLSETIFTTLPVNVYLGLKQLFDKLQIQHGDYNKKNTYLFSESLYKNIDMKIEDFYFGYNFPENSYSKLLSSTNKSLTILTNIGSSKLIRFYDSLKVKNYSDQEVKENPDSFEEDLELGIMIKKKGVDKLNTILKKNKIEVSIEKFVRTKTISLPVPALKKEIDENLKGVVIEHIVDSTSDYIFFSIDRTLQRVKDGTMRRTITGIKVKPVEILKIDNSSYYLSGLICMINENNYISIIRCGEKYISSIGEIGNYEKLMEYQMTIDQKLIKEIVMRTCVLVFYEKL